MGIVECKECGKEISSEAKACPGCGAPPPKVGMSGMAKGLIFVGIGTVAFLMLGALSSGGPKKNSVEESIKKAVLSELKDPSSAVFGDVKIFTNTSDNGVIHVSACGKVSGKNSFGAYAGMQRFVSTGILGGDGLLTPTGTIFDPGSGSASDAFQEMAWNKNCLQ